MNIRTKEHLQLTHNLVDDYFPAWSPNGKWIAFSLYIPNEQRRHLCTIEVNGKNFHQLTQGGPILRPMKVLGFPNPAIYYPAWSPDSQWIAYVFSDDPWPFQFAAIYVIDAMGNGREKPILIGK